METMTALIRLADRPQGAAPVGDEQYQRWREYRTESGRRIFRMMPLDSSAIDPVWWEEKELTCETE